jgi:hypothetical protein
MGVFGMNRTETSRTKLGSNAQSKIRSDDSEIKHLQATIAKVLMINEALWEIVRDQHGLTDEDLHNKIHEVDMRDGQADGKNQRKATKCPNCEHMVSSRHPACLYCGHVMDSSIFDME